MKQWSDFAASQELAVRKLQEQDAETLACPACKNVWFEEVELMTFKSDHQVIPGQKVPHKFGPFIFLRCIKCDELTEPRLLRQQKDNLDKIYSTLLDMLEDKEAVALPVQELGEKV